MPFIILFLFIAIVIAMSNNEANTRPEASTVPEKKTGERTKNWSEGDDILLCQAWVHTSEDAVTSADQKYDTYWSRIYDNYVSRNPDEKRAIDKIETRFQKIRKETTLFSTQVAKVISEKKSGLQTNDMVSY